MKNFTKTRREEAALNSNSSSLTPILNRSAWIRSLSLTLCTLLFFVAFAQATDVGGYIYCDNNSNGSFDSGEQLKLAGLEVKIYNKGTNTLLKTVTTDANGFYTANPIANQGFLIKPFVGS